MRTPRPTLLPAVAVLAAVLAPPAARAQEDDLLSSLYTDAGIEVRNDDRVFALFCALNATGFDRADLVREQPFPKRRFHPLRQRLRVAFLTADAKLRKQIDDAVDTFFDGHPESVDAYVGAALHLGDAPGFKEKEGFPASLGGLGAALSSFAEAVKLAKVQRSLVGDMRAELKRLRDVIDGPFMDLRTAWHLDEENAPGLVVVPNALDAGAQAYAFHSADGMHVVIVGMPDPGKPVDLKPALAAYNHLLAEESVGAASHPALDEAVSQLRAGGVPLPAAVVDGRTLLVASAAAGAGAKVLGTDVEAAFKQGLVLAREFQKAAGEPAEAFPAAKGSLAAQVAGKADVKKLVGELVKVETPKPGRR